MRTLIATFAAGAMLAVLAGPAMADTAGAREIQSAVDALPRLGSRTDATLVGGAGERRLRRRLLDPRRHFRSEDQPHDPDALRGVRVGRGRRARRAACSGGGDLSGFSLPRVTLKFSGDATCDVHYYAELEFGHCRAAIIERQPINRSSEAPPQSPINLGPTQSVSRRSTPSNNFDIARGVDRVGRARRSSSAWAHPRRRPPAS